METWPWEGIRNTKIATEAIIAYLQVPPPNVLLIGRMVSSEGIEPESVGCDTPPPPYVHESVVRTLVFPMALSPCRVF
jgi:hypothetical protein